MRKGSSESDPIPMSGALDGCMKATITLEIAGKTASRVLGAVFMQNLKPIQGESLSARKNEALDYLCGSRRNLAGRALALLAQGGDLDEVKSVLEVVITGIEGREDCSDFSMVTVLWIWMTQDLSGLDSALVHRIRDACLGWRYWLDEPGNDVMWYWSENHVLCFHVSELLAGQAFPADHFPNSGLSGKDHQQLAEDRLARWFDAVEAHGLAEWNSASYYPIDFIGLFALYSLAESDILRSRARALLDSVFVMVALHCSKGVAGGSMGRTYDKELFAGPATELSSFAAVGWGQGWLYSECFSLPLFCLGDYSPPAECQEYAALDTGSVCTARYTQGHNNCANLSLWKTKHVQLSTVSDHKTGQAGHQQHLIDLKMAGSPFARLWINHPGEDLPWGDHRPSLWAGNGVLPRVAQHNNIAMLVFDSREYESLPGRAHAHIPGWACDQTKQQGHWIFIRCGEGYAGIWSSKRAVETTAGCYRGNEWQVDGHLSAWIAVAGCKVTYGSFDTFCAHLSDASVRFDTSERLLTCQLDAQEQLSLSYTAGLFINGSSAAHHPQTNVPQVETINSAMGSRTVA